MSEDSNDVLKREIAELSAQFVHDLATPLTSIQMNIKLLDNHLPELLRCYWQMSEKGEQTSTISSEHLELLASSPEQIKALVQQMSKASEHYWKKINSEVAVYPENNLDTTALSKNKIVVGQSLRILLVEDNAIHRKVAMKILSEQHNVDIAVNGQEAIEAVQKQFYDLVLMDLYMPVLSGQEAVAQIIQQMSSPPLIIGCTSKPLGDEKQQLIEQGFAAFISKPLDISELEKVINSSF